MRLSSRNIVLFFCLSLFVTVIVTLFISIQLASNLTQEVQNRETELIFSAIESGPLAISRLHSANIAQQELSRLMDHPNLKNRGFTEASIRGGKDLNFTFASWKSGETVSPECRNEMTRNFTFPESINPLQVKILQDSCFSVHEKKAILASSSIAGLLVAVIATIMFILSVTPVADAIRRAEKILTNNQHVDLQKIKFLPIRQLVDRALDAKDLEKRVALNDLATQVAHDIRSPLSALNMVLVTLDDVQPEKKDIIKEAVRRINNIANDLLGRAKDSTGVRPASNPINSQPVLLNSIVDSVIKEKKVSLKNLPKIELGCIFPEKEIFARVNSSALERTLSNLINNASESIDSIGQITVSLSSIQNNAVISISDTGRGIPSNSLALVGQKGYSFGKSSSESGNGLGVYFAKQTIESAGGELKFDSKVGAGTTVQIYLPEV